MMTDTRGVIRYVNPAFTEVTGDTLADVMGQTPKILKSNVRTKATVSDLWSTIVSGRT